MRTFSLQCTLAVLERNIRYFASKPSISEISLPKKKTRDSLSVLKALASTADIDPNAPKYRYIDDPFLIPGSQLEKRSYSLAKASGQKAAHYVMQTLPDFVRNRPMNTYTSPLPKSLEPDFLPKQPEDTLAGLEERISKRKVKLACQSYHALKDNNAGIPESVKLQLLELCCFYNCDEPDSQTYEEEAFFAADIFRGRSNTTRKTWKDSGFAEHLFDEIGSDNEPACAAIVKGRAKYFQVDKAFDLFQSMKEKNMKVDLHVYNAIFSMVSFLRDSPLNRYDFVKELLGEMKATGISPTLSTFNHILAMITRSAKSEQAPKLVMEVINEMKRCGIEPSLGSWTLVLRTYYEKECHSTGNLLGQIIRYLENKEFTAQNSLDYDFFTSAMAVNHDYVHDLEVAHKTDELLRYENNTVLLGDAMNEGSYYTNYLRLMCTFEQIDKIMDVYDRITPHAYSPTFAAYMDLLTAIDLNDGFTYVPQVWSDFVLFQYSRRKDLVEKICLIMAKSKQEPSLQSLFHKIMIDILAQYEADKIDRMLRVPLQFTGKMIGAMMEVLLNSDDEQSAWNTFNTYCNNRNTIEGFVQEESLVRLAEVALHKNDFEQCLQVVGIMADVAYPKLDDIVAKAKEKFTNEQEIERLNEAVQ